MATLTWETVGGNPAPGDPDASEQLSQAFAATAGNASQAHANLNTFADSVDDSIWRGEAADAFREKLGELAPQILKLRDSYQAASEGMGGYARALRDLQSQANTLLAQAQAAQTDLDTAVRSRDQTHDPAICASGYEQDIENARVRLRHASDRIGDLRDQRRAAENTAIARLKHAGDLGTQNDPWYKRAWDAVDRWVDEHADILRRLSSILKIVSAAAALLSLIPFLAPICQPIALIALAAALGWTSP